MSYNKGDLPIVSLSIDEIKVGRVAELQHLIEQEDVDNFANLTGDFNPLHVDPDYARTTSFGKPVVHGMLTSSFISTMVGMILPGHGALWTSQSLDFLRPVFVGDKITVKAEVTQVSYATQSIVTKVEISNQHNMLVVSGQSTILLTNVETKEEKKGKLNSSVNQIVKTSPSEKNNILEGEVCLILGGSGGIGAATAREVALQGIPVAITYFTDNDGAEQVVQEIQLAGGIAEAYRIDFSSKEGVENMFSSIRSQLHGEVTQIVFSAAPVPVPTPIENTDWNTFLNNFNIQIGGAYNCIMQSLPAMIDIGHGSIVLIGSIYGEGKPPTQQTAYVTIKAAMAGFARSLATELGPKKIRVNVVAPGMTQTSMTVNLPQKVKMLTKLNTPMRRLAEPEDIAKVVTFLLSDASRHISGETINVSGGL